MKIKLLGRNFFMVVAATLLVWSCTNETIEENNQDLNAIKATASVNSTKTPKEKFSYFKSKLDAGIDIKSELAADIESMQPNEHADLDQFNALKNTLLRAIDPSVYTCDSYSPLDDYLDAATADWGFLEIIYYNYLSYHPQIHAIYFADPSERGVFGPNGEYTNELQRGFKNLNRFWDIYNENIGMVPLTGRVYRNIDDLIRIEALAYPSQTDEENTFYAEDTNAVFTSDAFWNGTHPLLSFNAFALSFDGYDSGIYIGDKIAMGDGIMMGYDAVNTGEAAPTAILAHEYGHHIQFENDYFTDENSPEATRRTELMADAFAAYYLTHKRGATMNWWRVEQFMKTFYYIGDCSFSSNGHHGTPEQRLAAAKWGYNVAQSGKKKGKILSSEAFYNMFEAELDNLVNCADCLN